MIRIIFVALILTCIIPRVGAMIGNITCKAGYPCSHIFPHTGSNNTSDKNLIVKDVVISCSTIEPQAIFAYNGGSFVSAATYMQSWLTTTYGGSWAVLYSTNFGMVFNYVYPNVCEFSLSGGVYCGLFQETA